MRIKWPRVRAWGLSEQAIRDIIYREMHHVLDDIEYRLAQTYQVARSEGRHRLAYAEDLSINRHLITGYTVTANSPAGGQIAWSNVHIVFGGTDYAIADGNCASTDYYLWFQKSTATGTPPSMTATMQKAVAASKPTLATGDCIIFLNNAGVPVSVLEQNIPNVVANNAIDSLALQNGSVVSGKLGTQAVAAANIGNNVITSTQISNTAGITGTQIAGTTITAGNVAANTLTSSQISNTAGITGTQIAGSTLTSGNIQDGTIVGTDLSGTAGITGGQISATAGIAGSQLSASAGITGTQISGTAGITGTQLTAGTIGSTQLGPGAVSPTKLSILEHVIY